MRLWLPAVLLISSLLVQAQDPQDRAAPACGLNNVKFDVTTTNKKNLTATPDSGKALVYVIQDDSAFESRPRPTVRFGIDGSWVGATHANSWFSFPVDPGVHHLCANWQADVGDDQQAAALHFTAQPGENYFFRMRDVYRSHLFSEPSVYFTLLDSDEGQVLIRQFSFSISHQEK